MDDSENVARHRGRHEYGAGGASTVRPTLDNLTPLSPILSVVNADRPHANVAFASAIVVRSCHSIA